MLKIHLSSSIALMDLDWRWMNDKNVARWASLASILDRPWFGRVWVIQEVAMATQAQIVWGSHTCNWGALLKLVEWTTSNGLGHWLTGKAHSTIACWSTLKGLDMHETDHRGISDAPILILVWMFRHTDSTDPRDKVFALLGLTSNDNGIEPDYSLSCEDVYIKLAERSLELVFAVLSFVQYSSSDAGLRLPSWVPNWASESNKNTVQVHLFNRGFKAAASTQAYLSYNENSKILSVTGFVFDNVVFISEHILDFGSGQSAHSKADLLKRGCFIATFLKPVMKLLEVLTHILVNRVLKTLIVLSLSAISA